MIGPTCVVEIQRVSHARGACQRYQPLDKRVIDRTMDQSTRAGDAGLARCGKDAGHDAVDGLIQVCVVEHDVCRLSSKFQRDPLDASCGLFVDGLARSCLRR